MAKIKKIKGRQVFDSRGNPTVEAEVFLKDGHFPKGNQKGNEGDRSRIQPPEVALYGLVFLID